MPRVSTFDKSVTEGGEIVFEVLLSKSTDRPVTVQYATESGAHYRGHYNAQSGSDFTAASGTLRFAPGETRKTVRVSTTSDSAYEFNEIFHLRLSNPTNAWLNSSRGYKRATGTIVDDDPPPTVSISDGSATEGGKVEFKISLSVPTSRPVWVDFRLEVGPGDTATPLFDFKIPEAVRVWFGGGSGSTPASFKLRVVTADDDIDEEDETFTVRLSNPINATLGDATATGTIIDDDGTVQPPPPNDLPTVGFLLGPGSNIGSNVAAGDRMRFHVSLSKPSDRQVSVQYRTSSGTAQSGADFTPSSGLLVFPPGETLEYLYVPTTQRDRSDEGNKTFTVTLSNPLHATLVDATATGIITDADTDVDGSPYVAVKASTDAVEGNPVTITVGLSAPSDQTVTVQYQAGGGPATSGVDYVATSGTLTFAPQQTEKTVSVSTTDDSDYEGTEYFYLRLSNPTNAALRTARSSLYDYRHVTASILDNDDPPVASFASQASSAQEDSGTHNVTINLSSATTYPINVNYTLGSGTATFRLDYRLTSGSVSVPSGATTATIPVTIIDDDVDDSGETIVLILTAGTGYTPGYTVGANSEHTVTIQNHETPATPEVSISAGAGVTEGGSATFTLTASPAPLAALTVDVTVSQSGDYAAPGATGSRTVTVPTGGTATFTVATVDDGADEADGSVTATLAGGTGYTVSSSQGTATVAVADDDDAPLATPYTALIAKMYGWRNDNPVWSSNKEHTDRWDRALLAFGESVADDSLTPMTAAEAQAFADRGWTPWVEVAAALREIENGGGTTTPELVIAAGAGVTEGASATFTLTADPAPAAALTVAVTVSQSGDYAAPGATGSRTVTVPTGGTATFTVATVDDAADEADGSVTATLAAGAGYTVSSSQGAATVAVTDNDEAPQATPYAALIAKMYGWRNDNPQWSSNKAHTDRWDRALLAFGETVADPSLTPMTAAEAQAFADRGWTPWVEVAAALREIENGGGSTTPELVIAAGAGVTEGGSATFTLTANPAPAAALTVAVTVSQSGDYAASGATGSRTVTVPTGGTESFTVATVDDSTDEADGSLTAALAAGTGYTVSSSQGTATVAVSDNDDPAPAIPEVSISAGAGVTEGSGATFTLTANPAPAAALTVAVTVSQSGDYAASGATGSRTVTVPTGGTATFTVATADDSADEPDGSVTAALAAGTGYTVSSSQGTATVAVADNDEPGPGIVTKRSVAREGSDDAVVFTVRLSRAARETVTVDYATADGARAWAGTPPAQAGADYTAVSGRLTFAAGERFKFVSVPILDDAVDEGTEYFLLRFSNPQGGRLEARHRETQGLIRNDDHLQAMWLSRFGRTVGSQVTDAISGRLGAGLAPGAHATLAGQPLDLSRTDDGQALADALAGLAHAFGAPGAPAANDDDPFARHGPSDIWNEPSTTAAAHSMTGRDLLLGSAFHVAPAREGSGPGLAAWGRVAHGSFDGEHADDTGRTSVDGEVVTGVLGADADFGRLLAGVAVSLSEGEGRFDSPGVDRGQSGKIESTLTTVSPYAQVKVSERVSAWGLAGFGTGDMTIRFDDGGMAPIRTDLSMQMGALGARGALLTQDEAGGMDLALKADAFFVQTESEKAANSAVTTADASRLRLVLEGGRSFALSDTATLRPSLELGVRHDGGDAETGTGVELGGGVAWSDAASGLSIEAKGRMLVAHADSDYREWGMSATARLDPGERGRGLSFSLAPTIGAASSASERLWGARDARALAPGGAAGGTFEAARGLTAEAGYGMALFGDRFTGTPNVGFGMSDTSREYRMGWRLTSAVRGDPGFEVNLDATRREAANGNAPPEHGVMLRSLIRW